MNLFQNKAEIWRQENLPVDFFRANGFEHCYDRHTHDEFAIGVMEYGVQQFYCMRGQNYAVTKGIITINPDELHDGHEANGGRLTYRMMYIDPEYLRKIGREISKQSNAIPFFANPFAADAELAKEYLEVHSLFDKETHGQNCSLERDSRLFELLTQLMKRYMKFRLSNSAVTVDKKRIKIAKDFISESYAEKITLADLSVQVGLSRYHFLRMFKSITGIAPHAYLCQVRLNRARKMLQLGAAPISSIAQDTGFYDQAHFTKKFKSAFGVTPAQYAAYCSKN